MVCLLLGKLLLHLLPLLFRLSLISLQPLLRALNDIRQRQIGVLLHPLLELGVPGQLHRRKSGHVRFGHIGYLCPPPASALGFGHMGDLTRPHLHGLISSANGVGRCHLYLAVCDGHGGAVLIHHADNTGRAPDAGDHGGCTDIHGLIGGEGGGHMEEKLTGAHQQLQLIPLLTHLHLGGGIQLDRLGAVQADIGIALSVGGNGIAVVQLHVGADRQGLVVGVLDGHSSGGAHQPHIAGGSGGRQGAGAQGRQDYQDQSHRQQPPGHIGPSVLLSYAHKKTSSPPRPKRIRGFCACMERSNSNSCSSVRFGSWWTSRVCCAPQAAPMATLRPMVE